jgi:ribosomal protein S18 acetylase RimI-like enzyme
VWRLSERVTDPPDGPAAAPGGPPAVDPGTVEIAAPETTDAEAIVECWVDLAREQRQHGSDLAAEGNREAINATVLTHIVADEAFVARSASGDGSGEGPILGFVTFEAETGRYEETVDRGIVHNLYVRPPHRDCGIGRRLLERAEAALVDRGVEVLTLDAMAENDAARRFYERAAYECHRVTLRKALESDTHSKE